MRTSDTIEKLAEALAIAQGEMKHAATDAENPFFKSKYANLQMVTDACRPALAKNGLSVVNCPESAEGLSIVVTSRLMHKSGQWIECTMTMKNVKGDAQGAGSVITYARRYLLAALVGVAVEDDDGSQGSRPSPADASRQRSVPKAPPATPGAVTSDQIKQAVADWFGVNKEDTIGPIKQIKKAMGFDPGVVTVATDLPKIMEKIDALKAAGVTRDTLGDALKPVDAD